jgi:hypothetical protein
VPSATATSRTARQIDQELEPVYELLKVQTNPIAIKAALNLLGHDVGGLRLPLVEADEGEIARVRDCLERLGVLSSRRRLAPVARRARARARRATRAAPARRAAAAASALRRRGSRRGCCCRGEGATRRRPRRRPAPRRAPRSRPGPTLLRGRASSSAPPGQAVPSSLGVHGPAQTVPRPK